MMLMTRATHEQWLTAGAEVSNCVRVAVRSLLVVTHKQELAGVGGVVFPVMRVGEFMGLDSLWRVGVSRVF